MAKFREIFCPNPVMTVMVKIGGVDAEVLYAGAAPGLISGLLQVNVRIPQERHLHWASRCLCPALSGSD